MRPQDIKIGEYYRHRTSTNYAYAKAVRVLKAKEAENTNSYAVVKCEWSVDKDDKFWLIKYFRPCDLIIQ